MARSPTGPLEFSDAPLMILGLGLKPEASVGVVSMISFVPSPLFHLYTILLAFEIICCPAKFSFRSSKASKYLSFDATASSSSRVSTTIIAYPDVGAVPEAEGFQLSSRLWRG